MEETTEVKSRSNKLKQKTDAKDRSKNPEQKIELLRPQDGVC